MIIMAQPEGRITKQTGQVQNLIVYVEETNGPIHIKTSQRQYCISIIKKTLNHQMVLNAPFILMFQKPLHLTINVIFIYDFYFLQEEVIRFTFILNPGPHAC